MSRRWPAVSVFALGIGLALSGCEANPSLWVDLRTDFVPGEELARVRTVVLEPAGDRVERESELEVGPGDDLLRGWRVAEFADLAPGGRRVRVALLDASGRQIIDRTVLVTHAASRVVTVVITRSCRDVSCPESGDDAGATECLGGRCVAPECLELDGCVAAQCASATDCGFAASCVTPTCEAGVCLATPTDGACADTEYCDPDLGCRPRGGDPDAGAPTGDAGPPSDAGCASAADCDDAIACTDDACGASGCAHTPIDARCTEGAEGVCVAGFGCQYAGCSASTCVAGPCETARCEGDTCVIRSACAGGQECCAGSCVAVGCDDGDPCTDDSCGGTGCAHAPNTASCDDGVFCNGSDTCGGGSCGTHAGDPCGGASVCDESASSCVGCLRDADCPGAMNGPWSSCSFASTCAESGTQERTVTSYRCAAGSCRASTAMESRTCSRTTDGSSCGSTSYTGWGACGGFADACDESGTQTRTRTDLVCASSACTMRATLEMQACSRTTSGVTCSASTFTPWGACGGFTTTCDESGTQSRTRTDYACAAETCVGMLAPEIQACARSTDGAFCENFRTCRIGSCSGGVCDAPGSCSGRCCEPGICVCSTCLCP